MALGSGTGTQTEELCRTVITRRALASLWNLLPTTTSTPGPRSVSVTTTLVLRPNCRATSVADRSFLVVVKTRTRLTFGVGGRVAGVAGGEPALDQRLVRVSSARPERVPPLKTLTWTWVERIRWPFFTVCVAQVGDGVSAA